MRRGVAGVLLLAALLGGGPLARAEEGATRLERREHPLMPALRWAYTGLRDIEKYDDYSCTLIKRERVNGRLTSYYYFNVKVRHEPFSVYLHFLSPLRGPETIFVEGKNDNRLLAHTTGLPNRLVGTVSLDPRGSRAMRHSRYPITELGIHRLVQRLIENGEHDTQYGECEVQIYEGAKVNERPCHCIEIKHPVPRREFNYYLARVFVDKEHNIPIRFEAYDWPREPGGKPALVEECTYVNLKFDNGFTDWDFDPANPDYRFPRRR